MVRGACDAKRETCVRNLVLPPRLVVGVQQHVRVPFDESRGDRCARQIDDHGTGRPHGVCGSDRVDTVVPDADRPPLMDGVAVENASRPQDGERCLGRAAGRQTEHHQSDERERCLPHRYILRRIVVPRQACLRTFSELAVRARRRDVERRRGFRGDPMMRRLFVAVGEFDQSRLAVRKAEECNADRQVVRREP